MASIEPKLLHVYSQKSWHDAAQIVGTHKALLALAKCILQALGTGCEREEFVSADGEFYDVVVRIVAATEAEALRLPYSLQA